MTSQLGICLCKGSPPLLWVWAEGEGHWREMTGQKDGLAADWPALLVLAWQECMFPMCPVNTVEGNQTWTICQGHIQNSCQLGKETPAAWVYWTILLKGAAKREQWADMQGQERVSLHVRDMHSGRSHRTCHRPYTLTHERNCPRRGRIEKPGYTLSPLRAPRPKAGQY